MSNICQYEPLTTISKKEIDRRFREIHRFLCYVGAVLPPLVPTTTSTTTTSTTTSTTSSTTTTTTTP